jgi:predicted dehydrogenase
MAARFRVGIVGAGENARDHGRACSNVEQAELVAICDISAEALDRFGAEFNVSNRYTDLAQMIDQEDLDIVVISVWGVYHAELAIAVANSGKVRAVLVEKPISFTAAECEEMIAAANKNGVLLAEAFKWRHDPQHLRVKEIIDTGRIGRPMSIQGTFSSPLIRFAAPTNWRYDRSRGGGSVFDTAGYLIHLARYLFDDEPRRVYASGSPPIEGADVEMSAAMLLQFPGDRTAQLTSSYEYGYCQATQVLGTLGWIRLELPFDQRSVREQEFVEKEDLPATVQVFYDNFNTEVYHFTSVNQFDLQLSHLCNCLATDKPHRIPPEFSLGNMRTIDAVHESIRSGKPVDLPA